MKPITPIIFEGKEYNEFATSLNAGLIPRSGTYTTSVNLTLTPMFVDEDGNMNLLSGDARDENGNSFVKRFSTDDIRNCDNMPAKIAFAKINALVEIFAIAQGYCPAPVDNG